MKSAQLFLLLLCPLCKFCLTPAQANDFEKQIRPLLQRRCGECHGPTTQKSSLQLDARAAMFRGGDNGPVIVPRRSDESEIFLRIVSSDPSVRMPPPNDAALSTAEIQLIKSWIDQGADWPETDYDRQAALDPRLDHWAWQPIASFTPPPLQQQNLPTGPSNEIDQFIAAELARQVQQFAVDPDPHAYQKLVDQLLASPHYGERWARHWLDIAHYADTHGFERDQRRDHAWRYRDWVIQALNDEMPYDQFLRDQIAGDVLRPDDPDAVAATGFLAAGPWDFVGLRGTGRNTQPRAETPGEG